jgi:hypothetical protein
VDIFIFNKREIEDYILRGVDYYEDKAEVNTVGRFR